MKALSIHPYFAMAIAEGAKSIECRTWKTDYRGDLLIVATNKKEVGTIPGHALCVVTLKDVRPFTKKDLDDAMMVKEDYQDGLFAWELTYNRLIKPIPLKGRLSLWNYDGPVEYIPEDEWLATDDEQANGEPGEWFYKYWEPLMLK